MYNLHSLLKKGDLIMAIQNYECPKGNGVIEEGFVDHSQDGDKAPVIWFEGSGAGGGDKGGLRKYRVQAYRCMSCGYTELYSEMEP